MTQAEAYDALGLADGSLYDDTLDTDALRRVIVNLRAIPGGMWDASFALGLAS